MVGLPLVRFGVHTPLQHVTVDELRATWRLAESLGFEWLSVWDHLQPVLGDATGDNLEAVAMHATLAVDTSSAKVACLVYGSPLRSAGVLAKAVATIDHLSHGRAVLGLGAAYLQREFHAFGLALPSVRERLELLEETVTAVAALFSGRPVTFEGRHVRLTEAVCAPRPVQERLPVWIGGGGERTLIPMAARIADGWNVPMATPADFARKVGVLRSAAEAAGRDPSAVETSVSLGLSFDEARLPGRFGARWEQLRPAVLTGSTQQVVDRIGAYVEAGAGWVILSLRPPFDHEELRRFAADVVPAFR